MVADIHLHHRSQEVRAGELSGRTPHLTEVGKLRPEEVRKLGQSQCFKHLFFFKPPRTLNVQKEHVFKKCYDKLFYNEKKSFHFQV